MNYAQLGTPGLSPVEMIVLAVLVVLVLGAGWAFYQKFSGRTKSDVSGLHFRQKK